MKRQIVCAAAASWALAVGMASAAGPAGYCEPADSYSYGASSGYSYGEHSGTSFVAPNYSGGFVAPNYSGDFVAPNYCADDECDRYACCFERFYTGIKEAFKRCALKKYKRAQRLHRGLMYPECPPYCSPTFGYHPTQWRPFPQDCEYVWTNEPAGEMWQAPAAPPAAVPLTPTPPAPGFPAPNVSPPTNTLPYFPEPPMSTTSSETAPDLPPGEAIPVAPPAELSATRAGDGFRPSRQVQAIFDFESPAQVRIQ